RARGSEWRGSGPCCPSPPSGGSGTARLASTSAGRCRWDRARSLQSIERNRSVLVGLLTKRQARRGGRLETCDECGFDAGDWTRHDLIATLEALQPWWEELVRGLDPVLLETRPAPTTWSAIEYAVHSRDLTRDLGRLLHAILTVEGLDLKLPAPVDARADDPPRPGPVTPAVDELGDNATRLARRAARATDEERSRSALLDGEPMSADAVLAHAVHDATHHLMDVSSGLRRLGAGPPAATGRVAQISASDGGVPKRAIPQATIGPRGVEGDRQATRRHHG